MTTSVLERPGTAAAQSPSVNPRRPPTEFGQRSSAALVEAGARLAQHVCNRRFDGIAFQAAVADLLALRPSREELHMAHDHLAFGLLDAAAEAQADALFVVDAVLLRIDRAAPFPQRRTRRRTSPGAQRSARAI